MRLAALCFMLLFLAPAPLKAAEDFNLAESLGGELIGADKIAIYIPGVNKDGDTINQFQWVNRSLGVLTELCGGATAVPPSIGWGKIAPDEPPRESETAVVYAFFSRDDFGPAQVAVLSKFLSEMARESGQDHLFIEYNNRFYRVPNTR